MLNLDYPGVLDLFDAHRDPRRTESASFLIWYLEHYYRLNTLNAVDCVCDQSGDKGVDGIYLNEDTNTIDVFQSKLFQDPNKTLGDSPLREFRGTLSQFDSVETLQNLVSTAGRAEVSSLISRLDLVKKRPTYHLRGVFLTNVKIDANATAFLNTEPLITIAGKEELEGTFISDERRIPPMSPVSFGISGIPICEYVVDVHTRVLIAPVKAKELVFLAGISDQSIFAFNVRGLLGRTQVNRDIIKSIKNVSTHKLFPLFHNGITIISDKVSKDDDKITIENYHVVNGCQSLSALYNNRTHITDDMRILTKVLVMDIDSSLSEDVTRYSNNQNRVRPRDFKSNDPTQIRLQNEFAHKYRGEFFFEIKRGESSTGGEIISNEDAGLYLMAFDLKEPWSTHRRYTIFDEKHAALFARPEVTADRILMCHVIVKTIAEKISGIRNSLFGKYALTKYALLFMFRQILELDESGRLLLNEPTNGIQDEESRDKLERIVGIIIDDIIIDINHEIDEEFGDDFDYRSKLRDSLWVTKLASSIVIGYEKYVKRGKISSFHSLWTEGSG